MRRAWTIGMLAAIALGCAAPHSEVARPTSERSAETDSAMNEAIRIHERFSEPIYVEIWANGKGPTTDALVAKGVLAPTGDGKILGLTDAGRQMGVRQDYFQDNIPVFYVPVGHRELIEVVPVGASNVKSVREVSFTYRNAPSKLGLELVAGGSRVGELDARVVRKGRAMLGLLDDGWRVSNLQL